MPSGRLSDADKNIFYTALYGPCRRSIPHLTGIAKKYAGKVDVIGVNISERGEAAPAKVKAFVDGMGEKMDYHVAREDAKGTVVAA